jgi:hypothetical protein
MEGRTELESTWINKYVPVHSDSHDSVCGLVAGCLQYVTERAGCIKGTAIFCVLSLQHSEVSGASAASSRMRHITYYY